jgi:hypothetical protein
VERLSRAAWREAPRLYSFSTGIRAAVTAQRYALERLWRAAPHERKAYHNPRLGSADSDTDFKDEMLAKAARRTPVEDFENIPVFLCSLYKSTRK